MYLLGIDVNSRQPAPKPRVGVVPSYHHLWSACLLQHVQHSGLEHRIYSLNTDPLWEVETPPPMTSCEGATASYFIYSEESMDCPIPQVYMDCPQVYMDCPCPNVFLNCLKSAVNADMQHIYVHIHPHTCTHPTHIPITGITSIIN